MEHEKYFLGIDGGGSKCRAIIVSNSNEILGEGVSGPANPVNGLDITIASIVESARLALENAQLDDVTLSDLIVGAGIAGVNLPLLFKQLSDWSHPFKAFYLTTDTLIACLGAHNGGDGAIVITGTGSCGFSHVEGNSIVVGAHGFPQGDKGSGSWLGLQAVQHALLELDGIVGSSGMSQQIIDSLKVSNAVELVEATSGKFAGFYAQFAGIVFTAANNGDETALKFVKEGADYISQVARLLLKNIPPRISILGGLSPLLFPWLAADVQQVLSAPLSSPEMGAIFFAKQKCNIAC
jgi:glucosamine kinase